MALPFDFDSPLPVAVIGAGPVGLAAAAHLLAQGEEPIIFEAGPSAGANVLAWGHVRLFSPWRYVIDSARQGSASRIQAGWSRISTPTRRGRRSSTRYLAPLAAVPALRPRIRLGSRVVGVARDGFDKMKTEGREHAPFVLTVESMHRQEQVLAKAVIDASGTTATPNPLGAAGIPAIGERAVASRIFYGIPDVLGRHRDDYASQRVLVVGSGHSAFNALIDLVDLAAAAPGTTITWAVRRPAGHLRTPLRRRHRRCTARSRRAWRARARTGRGRESPSRQRTSRWRG